MQSLILTNEEIKEALRQSNIQMIKGVITTDIPELRSLLAFIWNMNHDALARAAFAKATS